MKRMTSPTACCDLSMSSVSAKNLMLMYSTAHICVYGGLWP